MRLVFATVALAVALGVGSGPMAQAAPINAFATLTVGQQTLNMTLTPDPQNSNVLSFEGLLTSDLFDVQVNGTLSDAQILFGLAAQNLGVDPLDVALSLGVPINPLAPDNRASSGISGTLTDQADDGFSLQPTFPDMDGDGVPELLVATAGDPVNLGIDVGPGTLTPGFYGPFLSNKDLAGDPLLTSLQLDLALQLSGNGDFAGLQGSAQIAEVPEPATLALVATGALGLIGRARRGRRSLR